MSCEQLERDLDAYVDGELDLPFTAAVREHLRECAACRRQIAGREALGRLVRSTPYYSASEHLRARVSSQATGSTSYRRVLMWAAAALLVLSVGGGVTVWRSGLTGADTVANAVVDSHVRSLMADHLYDVESTDQHTVKPWFLGKLDFAPPVVDLAAMGFPLVGGRLEYLAGHPAAALVYQRQKHTINVLVSPVRDNVSGGAYLQSIRGFHVHHWTRDNMSFWAVSDLNDSELTRFATALGGS
jgi:anti-sigma factor RsiW